MRAICWKEGIGDTDLDHRKLILEEKERIEEEMVRFFERERELSMDDERAQTLLDLLQEYTLRGGKRVRAILVVLGYMAVGGRDIKKARRGAVAMELIQDMLLIHDDVMDQGPIRRGGPSFHMMYEELHRSEGLRGDPEAFGRNMAIIGGDLAESYGERALLDCGLPEERVQEALGIQTEMVRDTGYGQILDLYSEAKEGWTEEDVMKVHRYKTARYTIEAPLLIGAALSAPPDGRARALSEFGLPVGMAFQIVDDILGLYGDPARMNDKSSLSDLAEGKRTLLIIKALEGCDDAEGEIILSALGDSSVTEEKAEQVRQIVRGTGSLRYSRERAEHLTRQGMKALDHPGLDPDAVSLLKEIAQDLVGRADRSGNDL